MQRRTGKKTNPFRNLTGSCGTVGKIAPLRVTPRLVTDATCYGSSSVVFSITPQKDSSREVATMFVPLLLDLVRVENRPEVFMVFGLDRDKQTVDLLSLRPEILERGVHWTMLEYAEEDYGQPGSDGVAHEKLP
jgi:hypothetical protein